MSLKSILAELDADTGYKISNANQKAFLARKVNDACKEIWESRDLHGCLREQLFSLTDTQQLISFPSYLGVLRGVRDHENRNKITVHDQHPRYGSAGWQEGTLDWRFIKTSPIQREILNAAPFTLSIPAAETAAFTVYLVGKTLNSTRVQEAVTFAVGETEKTITNSFLELESFNQPSGHTYDVTLSDADGNELAVLANTDEESVYNVYQVMDALYVPQTNNPYLVEVLYKMRLRKLVNDYDTFPLPGYDKAIYWKTRELIADKVEDGVVFATKCLQLISQMNNDQSQAEEKEMQFQSNNLTGVFGYRHVRPMGRMDTY